MSARVLRITSRILFCICGLTSLLTAYPFVTLRGTELPVESEWIGFAGALILLGLMSLAFALIPRSWMAKLCKIDRDDPLLFSRPLKLMGIFAAIAYLVAVVGYRSPHSWDLNVQWMILLCPLYFVRMTVDPSPAQTFLVMSPMNAAVYGALGVVLGYVSLALRRRTAK